MTTMASPKLIPIAEQIWDMKYRLKAPDGTPVDQTIEDSWRRVAEAAAAPEGDNQQDCKIWADRFYAVMADFSFLPAGRILAGAGTGRAVTLFNCFVMGRIKDDLGAIFDNLREAALTMQQGGGIGHDFSTLRPKGASVTSIGADASGPVAFMDVWDAMCRTIMSAGARRGAMMGTMRCDHPDIEDFIAAKADSARLRNFNLSVLVSDDFIRAVRERASWDLVFDDKIYKTLPAEQLWEQLMQATYDYAEPGVIFIDQVNARNNLSYCEKIFASNPCGEQMLPPYGACLLGSINLTRLIENPFSPRAMLDENRLEMLVGTAVRFLDNIIDISSYPLPAQAIEAKAKRRIGLGITGLADALIMTGVNYGSAAGVDLAKRWLAQIEDAAYLASSELAAEKGVFPLFDKEKFLAADGPAHMSQEVRQAIAKHGIRNGLVTSIAPTGTISLLAGNVSSGIEPVFDFSYQRRVLHADSSTSTELMEDYAYRCYLEQTSTRQTGANVVSKSGRGEKLPDYFVTAQDLDPLAHLQMQAALQDHIDSSISKTINCPALMNFAAFKEIYLKAYELGLKGVTTFRPNPTTGAVLTVLDDGDNRHDAGNGLTRETSCFLAGEAAGGGEMWQEMSADVQLSRNSECGYSRCN